MRGKEVEPITSETTNKELSHPYYLIILLCLENHYCVITGL